MTEPRPTYTAGTVTPARLLLDPFTVAGLRQQVNELRDALAGRDELINELQARIEELQPAAPVDRGANRATSSATNQEP